MEKNIVIPDHLIECLSEYWPIFVASIPKSTQYIFTSLLLFCNIKIKLLIESVLNATEVNDVSFYISNLW